MQNQVEIVITEDGSTTLYSPDFKEHFHSLHGAIGESKHVFIEHGFKPKAQKKLLRILEIGFGTGLNMVLTYLEAIQRGNKVHYIAIEPYFLPWTLISKLNYHEVLNNDEVREILMKAFTSNYIVPRYFGEHLVLQVLESKLENVSLQPSAFDIVYYDAFSPDVQPELWTEEILKKIYDAMQVEGILVTYVAKGEVRRKLEKCGFQVERLPGFAKKREMLRATKPFAEFSDHKHHNHHE